MVEKHGPYGHMCGYVGGGLAPWVLKLAGQISSMRHLENFWVSNRVTLNSRERLK